MNRYSKPTVTFNLQCRHGNRQASASYVQHIYTCIYIYLYLYIFTVFWTLTAPLQGENQNNRKSKQLNVNDNKNKHTYMYKHDFICWPQDWRKAWQSEFRVQSERSKRLWIWWRRQKQSERKENIKNGANLHAPPLNWATPSSLLIGRLSTASQSEDRGQETSLEKQTGF